jgi:hypothetical protein
MLGLLVALISLGCAATIEGRRLCTEGCQKGTVCVAGRCRSVDAAVSPPDTLRFVLAPTDIVVSASKSSTGAEVPESVVFGRHSDGTVKILFRFATTWRDGADVVSAFLVLDPLAGAPPSGNPITFETAQIAEFWDTSSVSRGMQPRIDVPALAGVVHAKKNVPVRIDVTSVVRDWAKHLRDNHGLALFAEGDDAVGTAYSMGISLGKGPRLEVYAR